MDTLSRITVGTPNGTFAARDCPDCSGVGHDARLSDCRSCEGSGIAADKSRPLDDAARRHVTYLRERAMLDLGQLPCGCLGGHVESCPNHPRYL